MEFVSVTLLGGHEYSTFREAVGNIFMALWRNTIRHNDFPYKSSTPRQSTRAEKPVSRYPHGTQHTCFRFQPREIVLKGLLEIVGSNDSDWAAICQRHGIPLRSAERDQVQPKSETDSDQSLFMRSRVLRSFVCAGELWEFADFSKELHCSRWIQSRLQCRGPGGHKHIEIRCMAVQWVREKHLSVSPSGHEEQHRRPCHETFRQHLAANTVAFTEVWASNFGWYE